MINAKPWAQSSYLAQWARTINRKRFFGTRKLFSKKYTHAGRIVNTTLPACCIYHFTLQNLQSSAQNYQNAEDTAILYNIEAHKKQRQK